MKKNKVIVIAIILLSLIQNICYADVAIPDEREIMAPKLLMIGIVAVGCLIVVSLAYLISRIGSNQEKVQETRKKECK